MPTVSSQTVETTADLIPDRQDLVQLRAVAEALRAANEQLIMRERQIMELIGASDPGRILHDLRNILNERELLRAVANLDD